MKFSTFVYHGGEGYMPESEGITVHEGRLDNVSGFGYNDGMEDDEGGMTVTIEGETLDQCRLSWYAYAIGCSHIAGADDDHYDYWPSNFSGLVALATQIDEAGGNTRLLDTTRAIWDAIAWTQGYTEKDGTFVEGKTRFAEEILPRP